MLVVYCAIESDRLNWVGSCLPLLSFLREFLTFFSLLSIIREKKMSFFWVSSWQIFFLFLVMIDLKKDVHFRSIKRDCVAFLWLLET